MGYRNPLGTLALVFFARVMVCAGPGHADRWPLLIGVDKCKVLGELKVCPRDGRASGKLRLPWYLST